MHASRRPFAFSAAVLWLATAPGTLVAQASSHATPVPSARAEQRRSPVAIDGRLDEEAWAAATPISEFTQFDPDNGQPASQRTEVRILFDEDAIYVGAHMLDSLGERGVQTRLVRRDQSPSSDYFQIVFDTFHDHNGRALFQVNPSGVKLDGLSTGVSNIDASWDPVWEVATSIGASGWVAEMRIPFSQLRFSRDSVQTWGMQIRRFLNRRNEESTWAFWRREDAGGPSRFGHLEGIRATSRARRLEVLPYVVTRAERVRPSRAGDPFNDGTATDYRVGGDVKYLLTSNLTLDATINPDFGQVEVDPAVVNLSQFETFFPERRPFFIAGSGIFSFGGMNCYFCSNTSSLESFYSRRIGRAPQLNNHVRNNSRFSDLPENSTILGAAKITGRTKSGFTVGLLDAVTRRETATAIDGGGDPFDQDVEPLSNYFVGRATKDFRAGNLVVGAIGTSVWRDLDDDLIEDRLSRRAELVGTDFQLFWKERSYRLMGSFAGSSVSGSANAIAALQRSPARYFQRPDREHGSADAFFSDRYELTETSMRGYAGYVRLAKESGQWLWETAGNVRSPGYEVNDMAFQSRADYAFMNANLFRYWSTPTKYYRSLSLIGGAQQQFNYDGILNDRQFHGFVSATFPNFWFMNAFYIRRPASLDDRLTRGGPLVRRPGNFFTSGNFSSDQRKRVGLGANGNYSWNEEGARSYTTNLSASIRPASNLSLSLGPSYSVNNSTNQFVASYEDPTATTFFGSRYVFSSLAQRTLSMDTRLSLTVSPTLTFELFAQPFISSADYSRFKQFDAPRQERKSIFGRDVGSVVVIPDARGRDSVYNIDPDGITGPAAVLELDNPDFNLRSLRGNAVVRWEYRPGSTVFFVWTQQRSHTAPIGDFEFDRDRSALFAAHPDNIFLIKVNYWIGM